MDSQSAPHPSTVSAWEHMRQQAYATLEGRRSTADARTQRQRLSLALKVQKELKVA